MMHVDVVQRVLKRFVHVTVSGAGRLLKEA